MRLAFSLVLTVAALAIAWLTLQPAWQARRRRLLRRKPLPAALREILARNVPGLARLPAPLARRLESEMQVFLAEKQFVGCDGFAITDEVRATIAAQAVLLALGRGSIYPRLSTILVYPSAFVVERVRPEPSGIVQETRTTLSGESWVGGQVVLSWEDVLAGAADPSDGHNVVLHEFAHQLDQEKGYANGAPWLAGRERRQRWLAVFSHSYALLQQRAAMGLPSLLSDYAATGPEEFFAVACEVFFERPAELAAEDAALYAELRDFLRLDPLAW